MSKKKRIESIDYILLEAKMPAAYAVEIARYVKERNLVHETYRKKQDRYDLEDDLRPVFDRHEFMEVFREDFESTQGTIPFSYQELMRDAVISALEVVHTDDPAVYNDIITIVEKLFRRHKDGALIPTYSKRLRGFTRNVALGGGVYEVQVNLPDGKRLNLIAKQFALPKDFDNELRAAKELGEMVLATDSRHLVKVEFNKGKTTLAQKLRDSPQDIHYDSLVEVSRAVIRELQWAAMPGKFEKQAGHTVKGVTYLADLVRGKKYHRGKFYKIAQVDDFTEDFFDRFVFRLGGDLSEKVRKDGKIKKRLLKDYSTLDRLYRIMKKEVEPLFGQQKTQPLNPDLNGGNVLFDDAGNIRMIDRESMRVDHVQKCVYDLVEKRRLPLEQELKIGTFFYRHLDTGVDADTFEKIYLVRRVLEDLAFTKYLEYAKTRVSAQDPGRVGRFEDLALYYYNRAMRLASDDQVPLSDGFIEAVKETVDLIGINDKLRLITQEEFEKLEARVVTYHEASLSVGPMERLRQLRSGIGDFEETDGSVSALQFLWGKILAGSLAAGLLVGGTCGGIKSCNRMTGRPDNARTPAEYLRNAHSALRIPHFDEESMRIIESRKPSCGSDFNVRKGINETYGFQRHMKDSPVVRNVDRAYKEFGVSKRLLYSVIKTNACLDMRGWDEDKVGPMHVPREYILEHIVGDYEFLRTQESIRKEGRNIKTPRWFKVADHAKGVNNFNAGARYLKDCELSQDSDVVNTIADYYLGPRRLQGMIAKAGTTSYFDHDVDGKRVSGYSRFLTADTRAMIETAVHFYLHTSNQLIYDEGLVHGHGKR